MNLDDFERRLQRQPFRPVPPAWRPTILASAAAAPHHPGPEVAEPPSLRDWLREWLWPAPAAWAGLAAVWAGILVLNLAAPSGRELRATAVSPAPAPAAFLSFLEQRRQLEATIDVPAPSPADRPRPAPARSRHESRLESPAIPGPHPNPAAYETAQMA